MIDFILGRSIDYGLTLWLETFGHSLLNSFCPQGSVTIWQLRSGSTLAQIIAYCLTTPSHYLNQCGLIILKVHWHSSEGNFTRDTQQSIAEISLKITYLKFHVNLRGAKELTHWGRVTHVCISKLTIIGSDNGLSPDWCQAIIWTNAGILLIGSLGTNFSEILIEIHTFSFKKIYLKMLSGKWRLFCLGLNVLVPAHLLDPSQLRQGHE